MSILQKLSVVTIATAAVLAVANSANAFTITTGGTLSGTPAGSDGIKSSVVGATTIDFNSGLPAPGGLATYTGGALVTGTKASNYAAPASTASQKDTSQYLTIAPKNSGVAGATDTVTITLSQLQNYFGLHWGSVDGYNSIAFYNGANLIKSFTGADIPGTTASGNQSSPQDNPYVNFFGQGANEEFNKIVLKTTGIAFESDNHAFAQVPEPASILGLLAFGFLGAGSVVKRTSKTA